MLTNVLNKTTPKTSLPPETQERLRYIELLKKELSIPQKENRTKINAIPKKLSPEEQLSKDIFFGIEDLLRQAIQEGNYRRVQSLIGPEIYRLHQATNRKINQLRWALIYTHIDEKIYEQLFNTALWYARVPICKAALKNTYYKNEEIFEDTLNEWQSTGHYFEQFHKESTQKGMTTRKALQCFKTAILDEYSEEELKHIYKNGANAPIPILNTRDSILLKKALLECLNALPEESANNIMSIVKDNFDEKIKNAIISHVQHNAFRRPKIQNNINSIINNIFKKTSNLVQILEQLYQLWEKQTKKIIKIEDQYRTLIDTNKQHKLHNIFTEKYCNMSAVHALANEEILGVKNIAAEIVGSQLGELPLPNSFLSFAIEECKRTDLSKSEHVKRVKIAAFLIRHGCSLFSLPEYTSSCKSNTTQPYLAWPLIIASLNAIVCLTPTAETIRKACLYYAKKKPPDQSSWIRSCKIDDANNAIIISKPKLCKSERRATD